MERRRVCGVEDYEQEWKNSTFLLFFANIQSITSYGVLNSDIRIGFLIIKLFLFSTPCENLFDLF